MNHRVDTRDAKDDPGKLWLTETTGVLAFAHMPNLTLTVLRTGVESVAPEKSMYFSAFRGKFILRALFIN